MHFSRVRGAFLDPDFYLFGRRLPLVEQTRFLSIISDGRPTWVPHLVPALQDYLFFVCSLTFLGELIVRYFSTCISL